MDRKNGGVVLVPPAFASAAVPEREADTTRRREFVQRAVRQQYIPVAKSCYEELLERQPDAKGKVVLALAIVGDANSGGVVERVEVREETTLKDPEFLLCMRESMYSTIFEPPPAGARETTIIYPLELSP